MDARVDARAVDPIPDPTPGPSILAADLSHTGRVDCCVVCAVDDHWRWLDERRWRRERRRAERGADLDEMWVDRGGEG